MATARHADLGTMQMLKAYNLTNDNGVSIKITNFGGKIMSVLVPDRQGVLKDIVHGYDTPEAYTSGNPYFGAVIGRYANRIANGHFSIDGQTYQLNINNKQHALHGGPMGFHNKIWESKQLGPGSLELSLMSPDGEEAYPGDLKVTVSYTLNNQNELIIDYTAATTKTTVVNLTNHAFFNLAGSGDILDHEVRINADHFIPIDEGLIPIGEIKSVEKTPFDFRTVHTIGERIDDNNDNQLLYAKGYDHTFVLNKESKKITYAAWVKEPLSGRVLEVWTTEPGLQFYSGNFLDGTDIGKSGNAYLFRSAFCLEAQHFPDSPNQPNFPSTILNPGETYKQMTVYKFGVD